MKYEAVIIDRYKKETFLKDFETKEEALKYAKNHQFMYVDKIFVRNKETKEKVNNPYNPVIRVYKGRHLYIKGYWWLNHQ